MKGKDTFSNSDAQRIRRLLGKMSIVGTGEQKSLRRKLRELSFYITDYVNDYGGFSVADFDDLVERGRIRLEG